MRIEALFTTFDWASGVLLIGKAVLFQRLTLLTASMRVAEPLESCPPARKISPSVACSRAPALTSATLLPLKTEYAAPDGAPARP